MKHREQESDRARLVRVCPVNTIVCRKVASGRLSVSVKDRWGSHRSFEGSINN